jgi:hypothetical protein
LRRKRTRIDERTELRARLRMQVRPNDDGRSAMLLCNRAYVGEVYFRNALA